MSDRIQVFSYVANRFFPARLFVLACVVCGNDCYANFGAIGTDDFVVWDSASEQFHRRIITFGGGPIEITTTNGSFGAVSTGELAVWDNTTKQFHPNSLGGAFSVVGSEGNVGAIGTNELKLWDQANQEFRFTFVTGASTLVGSGGNFVCDWQQRV